MIDGHSTRICSLPLLLLPLLPLPLLPLPLLPVVVSGRCRVRKYVRCMPR